MSPAEEFEEALRIPRTLLGWMGVNLGSTCSRQLEIPTYAYRRTVFALWSLTLASLLGLFRQMTSPDDKLSFSEFTESIPKIIIVIMTAIKVMFIHHNERQVNDILKRLQILYVDQHEVIADDEVVGKEAAVEMRRLHLVVKILTNVEAITLVAFAFSPLALTAYCYITEGHIRLYFPMLMSYWWVEYDQPRALLPIYVHAIFGGIHLVVTGVGCDTLFFAYCTFLSVACKGVCARLRAGTDTCLRQTIINHQEILELVRSIDIVTNKPTLVFYGASTFMICFVGLALTVVHENAFSFLALLSTSFTQILLFSYFCDKVTEASAEIAMAVYETEWNAVNEAHARSLFIMLHRSQRPCYLTAYKFREMGLRSFTKVLSSAWSYFALLRTLYNTD